jgi:hypothetical protein
MKSLITAALFGAFLSGCVAHAHPPRAHVQVPQHQVKAWVWTSGYYRANGVWVRGTWSLQYVDRHMLNRHPRTHVRWVQGRKRPTPPPRHTRQRRRHRPRR